MNTAITAPWRIAVDVGGTFTDMALVDGAGVMHTFKVLSVPGDPGEGVLNVIGRAAADLGLDEGDLLGGCGLFIHGSTIATNTMIVGSGARVGLFTTRGFRDSLEIRRGIRENQWDHRHPFPPVLAPRHLRLPVSGRIDADGSEHEALCRDDIMAGLEQFAADGVEAIAIAFINSFLNADHERACADIIAREWDGRWVSVSSDVTPVMGEYARTSTTVVNAYLAPRVVPYLEGLNERLKERGLGRSMLLLQSNGGAISVEQAAARPVNLVLSGPAGGVGALGLYGRAMDIDDLVSMEIGGTSCDVLLMSEGTVAVTDALEIEEYHLATPSVDIHTVGSGGGTIAEVDSAGMLHVGPHAAGAAPGPACYGLGGEAPTVTDAQVVLGRLRPGPMPGGSVSLDPDLAATAITSRLAEPLGIDLDRAANGVIELMEQNLLQAVERVSTERGHDPRKLVLVAGGGAGAMHGARVGRLFGCRRVYVPRQAGVLCAIGMLHSNLRQDFLRVVLGDLDTIDDGVVEGTYGELEDQAAGWLEAEGFSAADGADKRQITREIDVRYRSQLFSLRIALAGDGFDPVAVRAAFEYEHQRQFGHIQPHGAIEITSLRTVATGLLEPPTLARHELTTSIPRACESRGVFIDPARGRVDIAIFQGADLRPGHRLAGPLIIEEQTTTVYVGPNDMLEVDDSDNFVIHLEPLVG
jgi:N-methylhydantoinase A